ARVVGVDGLALIRGTKSDVQAWRTFALMHSPTAGQAASCRVDIKRTAGRVTRPAVKSRLRRSMPNAGSYLTEHFRVRPSQPQDMRFRPADEPVMGTPYMRADCIHLSRFLDPPASTSPK